MPLSARVRLYTREIALLALGACAHSEPFQDPNETQTGPFSASLPLQLTYNISEDLTPVFLPGDSLLLYSFNQPGAEMRDRCLAALPVGGGTTVDESCPQSAGSIDSIEQYFEPAVISDSTIAYVQDLAPASGRGHYVYLGTAPWRSAFHFTPLLAFPYLSSNPRAIITAPTYLLLPGNGQVAFVANVTLPCCRPNIFPCELVDVLLGVGVSEISLATPGTPVMLSGIDSATSAGPGRTSGSILFTLKFDTRVYERSASGTIVTLFDFGPSAVAARDPALRGNRLVAVIGGVIEQWGAVPDSLGRAPVIAQVDRGGDLGVANLADGTYQTISGNGLRYNRPSLSAAGTRMLVQGTPGGTGTPNIYVIDVP